MTHAERKSLREKHHAFLRTSVGMFCIACKNEDGYPVPYPCDVIKVLDYLDVVEPMPQEQAREINWAGGK